MCWCGGITTGTSRFLNTTVSNSYWYQYVMCSHSSTPPHTRKKVHLLRIWFILGPLNNMICIYYELILIIKPNGPIKYHFYIIVNTQLYPVSTNYCTNVAIALQGPLTRIWLTSMLEIKYFCRGTRRGPKTFNPHPMLVQMHFEFKDVSRFCYHGWCIRSLHLHNVSYHHVLVNLKCKNSFILKIA